MAAPYYDEDGVTIYHGDCREILPTITADSVITDPPYGTGYYATDTDALGPDLLASLMALGPCAVFGYPERMVGLCVAAGVVPNEWVTWWPTNAAIKAFSPSGLAPEAEVVAIFGKHSLGQIRQPRGVSSSRIIQTGYVGGSGRFSFHGEADTRKVGDVWTDAAPGLGFQSHKRQHPNEKPMAVMRKLVDGVGVGTVLDPFCGSGTTLLAAKEAGLRAIGVELVEEHAETAAKRLAQGVLDFGAVS